MTVLFHFSYLFRFHLGFVCFCLSFFSDHVISTFAVFFSTEMFDLLKTFPHCLFEFFTALIMTWCACDLVTYFKLNSTLAAMALPFAVVL